MCRYLGCIRYGGFTYCKLPNDLINARINWEESHVGGRNIWIYEIKFFARISTRLIFWSYSQYQRNLVINVINICSTNLFGLRFEIEVIRQELRFHHFQSDRSCPWCCCKFAQMDVHKSVRFVCEGRRSTRRFCAQCALWSCQKVAVFYRVYSIARISRIKLT